MSQAGLSVGDRAPAFSLEADEGRTVKLSDFLGKKVVLYFYPKDDTPGCTREACAFQAGLARIGKLGAVVLGVSRDSVVSHQRFAQKFRLKFPLLSDPDASVCKAYGVYKQKMLYGRTHWGIARTTFVIDEQGRIARTFPNVNVDGHAQEVVEALTSESARPAKSGPRAPARRS